MAIKIVFFGLFFYSATVNNRTKRDYLFSTYAKFSEKTNCAYQGVKSVNFLENFAYALNKLFPSKLIPSVKLSDDVSEFLYATRTGYRAMHCNLPDCSPSYHKSQLTPYYIFRSSRYHRRLHFCFFL